MSVGICLYESVELIEMYKDKVGIDNKVRENSLWQYVKEHAMQYPDKCIYDKKEKQSFSQLFEEAEKLAKQLTGQKYGIYCSSDIKMAVALLACMAAGVTAVPLSNRYGVVHNKRIMKSMELESFLWEEEGQIVVENIDAENCNESELEDVAWILTTSGTTGLPKGVMLTQEAVLQNLMDSQQFFLSNATDKLLAGRGFYHCSSITGELLMSLIRGVDIYCYSDTFMPQQIVLEMQREDITIYSGTPTVFYYLCRFLKRMKIRNESFYLRYCNIGGEMMNQQTLDVVSEVLTTTQFIHSYGMTETCSRATYLNLSKGIEDENCVGQLLENLSGIIVDENGNQLGPNQTGELLLKGKSIMKGYYHNEMLTQHVFDHNWLRTGDIGKIDEYGILHICGRKDDMIIRGGINIYPQEIEQALREVSYIKNVKVCVERRTDSAVPLIAAYVLPEDGVALSQKELVRICKTVLPMYQMPDRIQVVSALGVNQVGKVVLNNENE